MVMCPKCKVEHEHNRDKCSCHCHDCHHDVHEGGKCESCDCVAE